LLICEESGFEEIRSRFLLCPQNVCQLEGSDHGGRDSAAELALAGIRLLSDDSYNRLTLGSVPPDARNYTPRKNRVNGFL